jgi:signal transduction histidine kinase
MKTTVENSEKDLKIDQIIEKLIYIIAISFFIVYETYNILSNRSLHFIILYAIIGISFIIFGYIWHHLINIKSIHRKVYIEELIITISLFISILLSNQINYLFFLVFPTITLTLTMLEIDIKEIALYIAILTLGIISLLIDPNFYTISNKFYIVIYFACIIFISIININYFSIYKTFTNKYKKEVELKIQNEELNKDKDSFFEIASKELRDPIQKTEESTEEILYHYGKDIDENINNSLSKILTNIKILKKLSENMLNIKNLNIDNIEFKIESINLKELIGQVVDTMSLKAKDRNIQIITSLDDSIDSINVDSNRIGEILRNLVDNSIKYSPENTVITISTYIENNSKIIEIKDQGIGIPKDDIPHLFEKFYRASNVEKNTKQGSGIGLFLVKEYIEKMNGKIEILSELNKGTRFKITFNN